jgi:hypothetical protein
MTTTVLALAAVGVPNGATAPQPTEKVLGL